MSNYLVKKYKGIYRLKAHIDESTNDYPRDADGNLDTDDVYIKCAYGCQIYHYGKGILIAYIPSLGRGRNILKALGKELCNTDEKDSYKDVYPKLIEEGTIRAIYESDEEVEFKFHNKHMELIAKYLKPQTSGAGISPFSTRNLPKSNYTIPIEDLELYKEITKDISRENILILSQITKRFIADILPKCPGYRSKNIKADMKLKKLKGKEYIHSTGTWKKYIDYLKKELETWQKE